MNLSAVRPTSPPMTPLVRETAVMRPSRYASRAFSAISSSVRPLLSEAGSLGEAQKAQRYEHLGSRVKNACPGQWKATGSNSILSMNGSPRCVR